MSRHYFKPSKAVAKEGISAGARKRQWLMESKRASILHLLDLKRAGHSPTRTELNIPSDDRAVYFPAPLVSNVSHYGSPAAAIAEG